MQRPVPVPIQTDSPWRTLVGILYVYYKANKQEHTVNDLFSFPFGHPAVFAFARLASARTTQFYTPYYRNETDRAYAHSHLQARQTSSHIYCALIHRTHSIESAHISVQYMQAIVQLVAHSIFSL